MENKSYVQLNVWKEARKLVKNVYHLSLSFPKEEVYGLTSQMRRCAISVPSNIAEGIGRNHNNDTIQFLYVSRGSLYELETQLYLAQDLNYISEKQREELSENLTNVKKLLQGYINYKCGSPSRALITKH
ncbi:MAG: four helix bundle protein [Cytophagaceae bacterium]